MAGFGPATHVFAARRQKDVGDRAEPGHDGYATALRSPHGFGRKLVFSHFVTSGTEGIFLLSYSHCARYCICAVCSFMCSCQSLVPKNFSGFIPASTSSGVFLK